MSTGFNLGFNNGFGSPYTSRLGLIKSRLGLIVPGLNETSQSVIYHDQTVNQTLTFNQITSEYETHVVNQTLTFSQSTIGTNSALRISQYTTEVLTNYSNTASLITSQLVIEVLRSKFIDLTVNQTLTFFQDISWSKPAFLGQSITQKLNFTETIHYDKGPIHNQIINQTLLFNEDIHFQVIDRAVLLHQTVNQILIFNEQISLEHRVRGFYETLIFTEDIQFNTIRAVKDQLIFNEIISLNRTNRGPVNQTLTFNQTINYIKSNLHQTVSQILVFLESKIVPSPINNQTITIPSIIYTKTPSTINKKCNVTFLNILTSDSITLRCPLFGDQQANESNNIIKRTITGKIYTYTKNTDLQKLNYSFEVDLRSALLFKQFIQTNLSKLLQLTNWKNETWIGYITNNPVDFIAKGRWNTLNNSLNNEAYNFSVEFQGVRIQ